jgi:hypothetical protein
MKLKMRKRKNKMSLLAKLAYEFLPTTDSQFAAIDSDIAKL